MNMKSTEQESMSICGDLTYFVMVYYSVISWIRTHYYYWIIKQGDGPENDFFLHDVEKLELNILFSLT